MTTCWYVNADYQGFTTHRRRSPPGKLFGAGTVLSLHVKTSTAKPHRGSSLVAFRKYVKWSRD